MEIFDLSGITIAYVDPEVWDDFGTRGKSPKSRSFHKYVRTFLLRRDGNLCGLCYEYMEQSDQSVDHKKPKSKGGTDDLKNLHLVHRACNQIKADLENERDIVRALYRQHRRSVQIIKAQSKELRRRQDKDIYINDLQNRVRSLNLPAPILKYQGKSAKRRYKQQLKAARNNAINSEMLRLFK